MKKTRLKKGKPKKSKSRKSKLKKIAKMGRKTAKDAGKFIYDNRDKIKEAARLVGAVVAVASELIVKPGKPKRRK